MDLSNQGRGPEDFVEVGRSRYLREQPELRLEDDTRSWLGAHYFRSVQSMGFVLPGIYGDGGADVECVESCGRDIRQRHGHSVPLCERRQRRFAYECGGAGI